MKRRQRLKHIEDFYDVELDMLCRDFIWAIEVRIFGLIIDAF